MTSADKTPCDPDKSKTGRSRDGTADAARVTSSARHSCQPDVGEYLNRFGPLVGGNDLWKVLGYRTPNSFNQACRRRLVPVRLFSIAHRKGYFAFTTDVQSWLLSLAGESRADAHSDRHGGADKEGGANM
jgi:hypothetical protein